MMTTQKQIRAAYMHHQINETELLARAPALYLACVDWLEDETNDAEFADQLRAIVAKVKTRPTTTTKESNL